MRYPERRRHRLVAVLGPSLVKAGVLLSVREKATRLPGKVLKPLGDGNVTQFLLRRLSACRRADKIILATSWDPRDAVLSQIAEQEGIAAFKGNADDKLLRYRDACRAFNLDFAVVVDGDDPFVSTEHVDRLIERFDMSPVDYVTFDNLPLGATGFGLSATALERVCSNRPEANTEIWGRLFLDDARFNCVTLQETDPTLARPDVRMTLDYEADYRFFVATVDGLKKLGSEPTFPAIMHYLSEHPEVVALNRDAQAAYELHFRASLEGAPGNGPAGI